MESPIRSNHGDFHRLRLTSFQLQSRILYSKRYVMPFAADNLETVRARFDTLVRHYDIHPAYKRFATSPTDDAGPHVEQHGATYAYVVTERGNEYERRETQDADELLYWLVADTTWELAKQFELMHRAPEKDSRRLLFARHLELLDNIRPDWALRKSREYDAVLANHPYKDGA